MPLAGDHLNDFWIFDNARRKIHFCGMVNTYKIHVQNLVISELTPGRINLLYKSWNINFWKSGMYYQLLKEE